MSDEFFADDVKAVAKALELINNWNSAAIIPCSVFLNVPEVKFDFSLPFKGNVVSKI